MEPSHERLKAFGTQLIEMHDWLRKELARLRSGSAGLKDLRSHCLAFCSALTRHHTGEDENVFPALAERHPELRPVLEELSRDHGFVTDILLRIAAVIDDPQARDSELDGLAAILESHFSYEERKIVEALNGLDELEGLTV
ncbi:hemerythrin domain-containing protein [Nonomuraea sp. NPDC050536]|uniref:hemerythrin domain-containing protein n=1 Tax=Nonomuraea sp. NPDC050536 TaxID=3364366 RepID=UPI0037C62DC1